jgi:hypothetical protein
MLLDVLFPVEKVLLARPWRKLWDYELSGLWSHPSDIFCPPRHFSAIKENRSHPKWFMSNFIDIFNLDSCLESALDSEIKRRVLNLMLVHQSFPPLAPTQAPKPTTLWIETYVAPLSIIPVHGVRKCHQFAGWRQNFDTCWWYFDQLVMRAMEVKLSLIRQVSDQGIPFRTFRTLEKCPFHVEINERKIKKWYTLIKVMLELYNHVLYNSNWKFYFLPI